MASTINEQQVLWAAAASKTVSLNTIQWSDAIILNAEDWDGSVQVNADNAGVPVAGDTCEVYVGWSTGDVLGDTGNDYDSDEHAEYVGRLDTYATNIPGEDPARRTWPLNVSGKSAMRIGVVCAQASVRNIVVRARLVTHRPQDLVTLDVKSYGAVGNGIADDTAAFNAALLVARDIGGVVVVPSGIFLVGQLLVLNGVRGILGTGGTLLLNGSLNAGILLRGQKGGETTDVSNCFVQNVRIDANNSVLNVVCIWGQNVSDVRILDNVIINVSKGWGILLLNYTVTNPAGGGNKIQRNKVFGIQQGPSGVQDWFAIGCYAEPIYTTTPADPSIPPATDQWRKTFIAPSPQLVNGGNMITDNRVVGGYYGFFLSSLVDSVVANNSTQWNGRGISLQNNAARNVVTGNKILENYSAGIHLAFGSSDNLIDGNFVSTSICLLESLIQGYIGCQRNTISNNKLICTESTTGSQHGVYVAVHATGNSILNNTITGKFKFAAIGVSSAWNTATTEIYRYAKNGEGSNTDWMANQPTSDVVVAGNIIRRLGNTMPAILLDQCTTHAAGTFTNGGGLTSVWDAAYTASYAATLTNCIVRDNTVVDSSGLEQLRVYEDTVSGNNNHVMSGNNFWIPTGARTTAEMATYYQLPRGRAHFLQTVNNINFDKMVSGVTLASGISPSVAVGEFFNSTGNASVPSTLTGGIDGQEIRLRLNVTDGLAHTDSGGADTMRLLGRRSIKNGSANSDWWLTLRRQGGVWFETARSTPWKNTPVKVNGTTTSCANGGAFTKLTWPTVVDNVNGEWAANTFTAKLDGLYLVSCQVSFTGAPVYAVNEQTRVNLYKNGVRIINGATTQAMAAAGLNMATNLTAMVELIATDTLELYVFNNCSGGAATPNGVAGACWALFTKISQ